MKMVIMLAMVVIASLFGNPASSQVSDELKMIQEHWGLEKKELMNVYLGLTQDEADKFWPIYDAYAKDRQALGKERMEILQDYANSFNSLTNEQADNLVGRFYKNNIAIENLEYRYYKKIKKATSALLASKFIQAEKYVETILRAKVQSEIPFIGEEMEMVTD